MRKLSSLILLLAGCATAQVSPLVDRQAPAFNEAKFSSDLSQCNGYAVQVEQQALNGAIGGALIGAMLGAVLGDTSAGAQGGAMGGAVGGAANTYVERQQVVRNCQRRRGYRVLN